MQSIKFSHNWNNKLNNDIFTTIRIDRQNKYMYYRKNVGNTFDVVLNNEKTGEATLLYVKGTKYKEINALTLMLDTGLKSITEVNKLFGRFGIKPETSVLILVFERIK